jgi:hypothetical protein
VASPISTPLVQTQPDRRTLCGGEIIYKVTIDFDSGPLQLLRGMTGDVQILAAS